MSKTLLISIFLVVIHTGCSRNQKFKFDPQILLSEATTFAKENNLQILSIRGICPRGSNPFTINTHADSLTSLLYLRRLGESCIEKDRRSINSSIESLQKEIARRQKHFEGLQKEVDRYKKQLNDLEASDTRKIARNTIDCPHCTDSLTYSEFEILIHATENIFPFHRRSIEQLTSENEANIASLYRSLDQLDYRDPSAYVDSVEVRFFEAKTNLLTLMPRFQHR